MQILSIQSSVAYGYVGNSAAVFGLQRLGHEVWPVHTVHFSNHTGYGEWRGPVHSAEEVAAVIDGIAARGVLPGIDAVLSGYLGDPAVAQVVADTVARVKAANPAALYCCDPVIGDVGRGVFVRPEIPEFFSEILVPAADVITPNHFELGVLVDGSPQSVEEVRQAAASLPSENVLVTSVITDSADELDLVAVDSTGAWTLRTPLLAISPNGGGDVTAALYLAHLLATGSTPLALERTANSMFAILEATVSAGRPELMLAGAADAIAHPPTRFTARALD